MSLNNLALCILTRYEQLGSVVDLDEVIVLGRETLESRPQGHADRSDSLKNLSRYLHTRFTPQFGTGGGQERTIQSVC